MAKKYWLYATAGVAFLALISMDLFLMKQVLDNNSSVITANNVPTKNVKEVVNVTSSITVVSRNAVVRPTVDVKELVVDVKAESSDPEFPVSGAISVTIPKKYTAAEALLTQIEQATPNILLDEIKIVQTKNNQWVLPSKIGGFMSLSYLEYDLELALKMQALYKRKYILPAHLGAFMYYKNASLLKTYALMLPFKIPFTPVKLFGGVGLDSLSLTMPWNLTDTTTVQLGMFYMYDRTLAPAIGLGFKF